MNPGGIEVEPTGSKPSLSTLPKTFGNIRTHSHSPCPTKRFRNTSLLFLPRYTGATRGGRLRGFKKSLFFLCIHTARTLFILLFSLTFSSLRLEAMGPATPLAIEYPSAPAHTIIPISSGAETPASTPEQAPQRERPFSIWKRICECFTSIFTSRKEKELEDGNKRLLDEINALKEENKALKEKAKAMEQKDKALKAFIDILKEKHKTLETEASSLRARLIKPTAHESTKIWLQKELEHGTHAVQEMLKSHNDEVHEKRMSELRLMGVMFRRHEEVTEDSLCYKQGYEEMLEEMQAAQEEIARLEQRVEDVETEHV